MRVLFFSPRECLPFTSGARVRDFHLARELARQAKLTYLGFANRQEGLAEPVRRQLQPLLGCETVLVRRNRAYSLPKIVRGLVGKTPVSVLNYASPIMTAELRRILEADSFDVVQMVGVHLYSYLSTIRTARPNLRLICDWHNIESELMIRYGENAQSPIRRLYARRTAALLGRLEEELLERCDAHTVCSERERNALLKRCPGARIQVVDNGVDTAFYSEAAMEAALRSSGAVDGSPRRTVLFVGSMDYHANIDAVLYFADEVWPRLRALRPELDFLVVGSRPVSAVLALGRRPGVSVTGTVADLRPYYRRALTVVVPLRVGGGTRLKVLEAMAAGTPVISTRLGVEGLAVTPGKDVLLADSAAAMAESVGGLDEQSPQWQALAANGRMLARFRYDWVNVGESLRRLYAEQPLEPARR
jgi:glycosyltransferase involved in cell wall biosynthesis